MLKRLRSNEQMVDRLARQWGQIVMKKTLVDWKKLVVRKKYTRVLLEKTSGRWTRQKLLRVFRAWSAFAVSQRIQKATDQIQQFRDNRHELQELLGKLLAQIDSARSESKTHREHTDYAKRHALSLEELLSQLELRVRSSEERQLQEMSNQWAALCFALVDCQCDFLQNMLDAVTPSEFVDANVLLGKGEELSDLLALPSDALVLRWINFQLSHCDTFRYFAPSPGGFIQNFSTDMHRHYVLRHILHHILSVSKVDSPKDPQDDTLSADALKPSDPTQPSSPFSNDDELHDTLAQKIAPSCPLFLCRLVYDNDKPSDLMFCLFSFLMCEHPSIGQTLPTTGAAESASRTRTSPWHEAQTSLDEARQVWETVRDQWAELREPFEIQEDTKLSPDQTNPPMLLARGNIALQNAVNTVQYACSKRSIVMRAWECLQRRVQDDALHLLMHRGRTQPPVELVDRRLWREKFMLTTLHYEKLVPAFAHLNADSALLATDSSSHESKQALEAELLQVETVLEEFYDGLRHVYRFYATIDQSGRARSVANQSHSGTSSEEEHFFRKIAMSMSLEEFHAFLKDCKIFGTTRSFPYAFIQQVFEHVNCEVAAAADSATVRRLPSHFLMSPEDNYDDNASEMTPAEFIEALVHIVRSKYVCFKGKAMGLSLAQRMRKCIVEIILPNATQEREGNNIFRSQLLTSECRIVFSTYQKKLLSIYSHFAALESRGTESEGKQGRMLSIDGLVTCCKHFDLFRESLLKLDDIQHILAEVLQLDRDGIHFSLSSASNLDDTDTDAVRKSAETTNPPAPSVGRRQSMSVSTPAVNNGELPPPLLTFAEFLEVMSAVACYLNLDAFSPLAAKLEAFFAELSIVG